MTTVNFKRLTETAILPTHGSAHAAGYDLYADTDKEIIISPHRTIKIGTGWAIAVPDGYAGLIFARSGTATKRSLRPANCTGVCDSDYTGEYIVAIHNDSDEPQTILPHERIAQLVIMPHLEFEPEIVDDLDKTERGDSGFNSTGRL